MLGRRAILAPGGEGEGAFLVVNCGVLQEGAHRGVVISYDIANDNFTIGYTVESDVAF